MSTDDIIISHPVGTRTLALRESYLAICDGDKCEAHLLNANERWYAYKLKHRQQARHVNRTAQANGEDTSADESLWVFMSAQEWVTDLLNQYDEKTVRNKLARLVERGFLSRRSNPTKKWDRKPQWLFMRANVQAAVDAWASARMQPDIDPNIADLAENADQDNSGNDTGTTRENARMDSGEIPNADGKSTDSNRANARSNTTGISHRDLSQESFTGGDTREANAAPHHTEYSSSDIAARETADGQTSLDSSGAVLPPNGGTADAAGQDTNAPSQVQVQPTVGTVGQTTSTEQVPAAAGAPSGDQDAPAVPSVDALRSVPASELSSRVPALPESPEYKALSSLFGKHLGGYLQEYTRTGSIPRTQWLRLMRAEVELVRDTAQAEARATQGNMLTLAVRGLDRLIGAVSTPRATGSGIRPDAPTVTPNGSSLNGFAPVEQVADVASTDRYGQGARWQARDGGAVLTIQRTSNKPTKTGKATLYHLSDGRAVNALELMRDFDHVG